MFDIDLHVLKNGFCAPGKEREEGRKRKSEDKGWQMSRGSL